MSGKIDAITLWNPYALAMALDVKHIETRHWPTDRRGLVAIHAAQRWTPELREQTYRFRIRYPHLADQFDKLEWGKANVKNNPYFGAVLCIVRLVDCVPTERLVMSGISAQERDFDNFAPGRFGFVCELVESFLDKPYPQVGCQKWFKWERPAA